MKLYKRKNDHQVYLFDLKDQPNSLKEFLYFLKSKGVRGVIDFSLSTGRDTIHPNISLKDNFILDSVPTSLIKNKEDNLRLRLSELKNKKINQLIELVEPIETSALAYDDELTAVASIIKSLLSESKYLFLVNPEKSIRHEYFEIIKEALLFEVKENNRSVFITSTCNEKWLDLATNIVTKNNNFQFDVAYNNLNTLVTQDPIDTSSAFQLVKKAS